MPPLRQSPYNLLPFYGTPCAVRTRVARHYGSGSMDDSTNEMLHWLVGDCRLFGLTMQNWMPLFVGVFLIYIVVLLALNRHDQQRVR